MTDIGAKGVSHMQGHHSASCNAYNVGRRQGKFKIAQEHAGK
jgi:hypothetical protein